MKTTNSNFNFFVPIDFEKSVNKKGEKVMKIKGIASTPDEDSEGETLLPVGFDLSRFLNIGYLNYNHGAKNDASKIIGEPTVAKITEKGELYVEGVLYNGHPLAESVWSMAQILEKNGSTRRMGFSIEGRATERDPMNAKRITKALLTGLAITPTPVNSSTYMDLCKGIQEDDFVEYKYDHEAILEKAENSKYLYEFNVKGKTYGITKSFEMEVIGKAMDVASGAPLMRESLDKKLKNLEPNLKKAILDGIVPIEKVSQVLRQSEGVNDILKKALLLDIIPIENADIILKGKRAFIGEIRKYDGYNFIKTADGWKPYKGPEQPHAVISDLKGKGQPAKEPVKKEVPKPTENKEFTTKDGYKYKVGDKIGIEMSGRLKVGTFTGVITQSGIDYAKIDFGGSTLETAFVYLQNPTPKPSPEKPKGPGLSKEDKFVLQGYLDKAEFSNSKWYIQFNAHNTVKLKDGSTADTISVYVEGKRGFISQAVTKAAESIGRLNLPKGYKLDTSKVYSVYSKDFVELKQLFKEESTSGYDDWSSYQEREFGGGLEFKIEKIK